MGMLAQIDREKVLTWLEICGKNRDCSDCCPYGRASEELCRENLMTDALALLKEQEPKPIAITTNAYGTKFYHCPRCNHDLYAYPRQIYCSQCGQAVIWE